MSSQFQLTRRIFNKTLRYLWQFFYFFMINRDLWPAVTPLDYYLFLHLKNTIFKEPVHTIDDLKSRMKEECDRVTP
jgi:hypothetical protein